MMRIIFILLLWLITFESYAWNALGHMVVATIAYDQLKPDIQQKVDQMVADLSKEYPDITTFPQMAPWPDSLRSQQIEIYTHWHYVDKAFSTDGTPVIDISDTDNVLYALKQMEPILRNAHANAYEKARFLAFLIHCVGDIHQPLHTVSKISAAYPYGDQGGNLYYIHYPTNAETMSLHKLWDGGIDFLNMKATDANAKNLATVLVSQYPESDFGTKATNLEIDTWGDEGFYLATTLVYQTPENQVPTSDYLTKAKMSAEQQLALAGYRLAHLINDLLGSDACLKN